MAITGLASASPSFIAQLKHADRDARARSAANRPLSFANAPKRFEIVAGDLARNTDDPGEALIIARFYANAGADVSVRDRSKRRGYLTEAELEALA